MKITNRQAAETQFAIATLLTMNLPIKTSLEVALLSTELDKQVAAFQRVRDSLIKNYQIKVVAGGREGTVTFETSNVNKEKSLMEFTDKVNELFDTETQDINVKLHLPGNIDIRPDVLKPILPFIELV